MEQNEGIPFWGYVEYRESELSSWIGFARLNFYLDFGNGFDYLDWRGMPADVSILFLLDNSIVSRTVLNKTQTKTVQSNLIPFEEAELLKQNGKAILIDTGSQTYVFYKKLRISWAYASELETIHSKSLSLSKLKAAIQMMKSLSRGNDTLSRMIYWHF
jgi:hypothetical protein